MDDRTEFSTSSFVVVKRKLKIWATARSSFFVELFKPSFYIGFWLYCWITITVGAGFMVIFESDLAYIDAFYIASSAFGEVGLSSRDLSQFSSSANVTIGFIMLLGSGVLQTCIPLVLRRLYFKPQTASRIELLEYQAMGKLLYVINAFFWGTQFFFFVVLTVWLSHDTSGLAVLTRNKNSPMGWSAFMVISAMMSNGLATLPDNLIEYYAYPIPLLTLSYLTLVGETMYPIILRFILWILHKFSSGNDRRIYSFILRHPRRLYTHCFPFIDTLWLLSVVIIIDLTEFIFLLAADWNGAAFNFMSPGQRILNAFFMSTTTRTSGFASINIALLDYGMLALYCGTMYLSTTPVYAVMRRTQTGRQNGFFEQAKQLLIQDVFFLFLIFVAVMVIENDRIVTDPSFAPFNIIFEIISAYGTVGLSFGYPTNPNSFSGVWRPLSKFLISCAMIMGRLRFVPLSDERAIHIRPRSMPLGRSGSIYPTSKNAGLPPPLPPSNREINSIYTPEKLPLHSGESKQSLATFVKKPSKMSRQFSEDPTATVGKLTQWGLTAANLQPQSEHDHELDTFANEELEKGGSASGMHTSHQSTPYNNSPSSSSTDLNRLNLHPSTNDSELTTNADLADTTNPKAVRVNKKRKGKGKAKDTVEEGSADAVQRKLKKSTTKRKAMSTQPKPPKILTKNRLPRTDSLHHLQDAENFEDVQEGETKSSKPSSAASPTSPPVIVITATAPPPSTFSDHSASEGSSSSARPLLQGSSRDPHSLLSNSLRSSSSFPFTAPSPSSTSPYSLSRIPEPSVRMESSNMLLESLHHNSKPQTSSRTRRGNYQHRSKPTSSQNQNHNHNQTEQPSFLEEDSVLYDPPTRVPGRRNTKRHDSKFNYFGNASSSSQSHEAETFRTPSDGLDFLTEDSAMFDHDSLPRRSHHK